MDLSVLAVAILAAVSTGGVAYALVYPYLSGDIRREKRQSVVATNAGSQRVVRDRSQDLLNKRKQVADSLKELDAKQKAQHKVNLERRITQAGLAWSKPKYFLFSAACGCGAALALFVASHEPIMAGLGLVIGALGVPNWLLGFLKKRRIKKFIAEFPNAMDVIVRGIKSGLPLGDCLRIIAAESSEPVGGEFRTIVETQTLGVPVGEACMKLFERIPTAEANFFGIVIQIQQKAGGNLSEALGNLSRVLRERKKMRGKIIAMSMEAKASAAIIAALPFIVAILVYLSSPRYIELLWITQTGKLVMAASGFWMFMGVMAMKKMISFDI